MVVLHPCCPGDCGKRFRDTLKKPSPTYSALKGLSQSKQARLVPAFTIQALQPGTRVQPPPKCGVFLPRPPKSRMFRKCYQSGEFPAIIEFDANGRRLCWKVPVEKLDYHHYLPMFCDGLAETSYPYTFYTYNAIRDMVNAAPNKVLSCVPQLIIPFKNALDTRRPSIICNTLKVIRLMVESCHCVGEALVPYYRQLLPICNLFREKNCNLGAGIDHSTNKGENVGDMIQETLQILEKHGGDDAFINIKYMVPTYESCIYN